MRQLRREIQKIREASENGERDVHDNVGSFKRPALCGRRKNGGGKERPFENRNDSRRDQSP